MVFFGFCDFLIDQKSVKKHQKSQICQKFLDKSGPTFEIFKMRARNQKKGLFFVEKNQSFGHLITLVSETHKKLNFKDAEI